MSEWDLFEDDSSKNEKEQTPIDFTKPASYPVFPFKKNDFDQLTANYLYQIDIQMKKKGFLDPSESLLQLLRYFFLLFFKTRNKHELKENMNVVRQRIINIHYKKKQNRDDWNCVENELKTSHEEIANFLTSIVDNWREQVKQIKQDKQKQEQLKKNSFQHWRAYFERMLHNEDYSEMIENKAKNEEEQLIQEVWEKIEIESIPIDLEIKSTQTNSETNILKFRVQHAEYNGSEISPLDLNGWNEDFVVQILKCDKHNYELIGQRFIIAGDKDSGTIPHIRKYGFYEGKKFAKRWHAFYSDIYEMKTTSNPFRIDPTMIFKLMS